MNIQLSDHFNYKKLFLFTLPSVVMMVFTSVYCVVDGFFVSNFAGKTAFAAINLIMPFIMILGGIGFMIGTGGSALVSYTLGTGDKEKANRYFSMLVYFTILAGILLTVLGIIFVRPIAELFGADESMMDTCVLYGRIVIAFNAAFMLQNIFQSFFVVAEKPRLGLIVTIYSSRRYQYGIGCFIRRGIQMGHCGCCAGYRNQSVYRWTSSSSLFCSA